MFQSRGLFTNVIKWEKCIYLGRKVRILGIGKVVESKEECAIFREGERLEINKTIVCFYIRVIASTYVNVLKYLMHSV